MRYISPFNRLTLYGTKGQAEYIFRNGELIIGDTTTFNGTDVASMAAGYAIMPTATFKGATSNLFDLMAKVTTSTVFDDIEVKGMGYLDGGAIISETIAPIDAGWQSRLFFPAPIYTGTKAAIVGAWYQVLSGAVSYGGVIYKAGKFFKGANTNNITVPTAATYALGLPPELRQGCTASLDEQFKIKHLEWGDEPYSYFNWDSPSGFEPRNSLSTVAANFIGYSR